MPRNDHTDRSIEAEVKIRCQYYGSHIWRDILIQRIVALSSRP